MTLSAGSRLGPYEVLSPLGAGGMGEVWRARDGRLDREVAIKVLPADVASDASRLKRFETEARAASSLNHPNIVTIYDLGVTDGVSWIAMERVEGRTLRELLASGALPVKRVLAIGAQIADGLSKAHEAGIVHRDLKPENVMVTKDGLVKILDFGLAKVGRVGSGSGEASQLPTEAGTSAGVVLGTVGYMSPEQASGQVAGFRSDQFALGSMLYEMATGARAFKGNGPGETLAAVLRDEPRPVSEINPEIPAPLGWIIERCLAKEADARYSATQDLARDLANVGNRLSEVSRASVATRRSVWRRRWLLPALAALGAAALAISGVSLLRPRPPTAELSTIRFTIRPPQNAEFSEGYQAMAFSPDGSQLAFFATTRGDAERIWLRPLSTQEARAVPGTDHPFSVFWSPDGRSVGFFAASKLWRVDLSGGAPVPICDVPVQMANAGTWGAGGQILFAPMRGEAIYRVSASGGKPVAIVTPDRARGQTKVTWPWFLPDGRSFLYHLRQEDNSGTLMFSPPEGPARPLFPMLSRVEYVDPGYLVYVWEGTLIARRFDYRSGAVSGEPFSIADSIDYFLSTGMADFAASRGGTLAFQTRTVPRDQMVWVDRAGRPVETLGSTGGYGRVDISPDGRKVLFQRAEPKTSTNDLWIMDLERKVETRVTFDPADEFGGIWLPDGRSIAYTAERGGLLQLRRRELATGREEALLPPGAFELAADVLPGGTALAYSRRTDRGDYDVELVSLSGDHKSSPLLQTPFTESECRFSPDGRFIVFVSNESGGHEAYVAPVASVGEKTRVSTGGAALVRWRRDGNEILYLAGQRQLVSVPIRTAPSLSLGQPAVLFTLKEGTAWSSFDVTSDGKRFLAVVSEGVVEKPPLNVVVNWTAEARR